MEILVVELAVGATFLCLGWLHNRLNRMEDEVDNCVHKDNLTEVKEDLKEALHLLNESRVENALWQGRMEKALERDLKNS